MEKMWVNMFEALIIEMHCRYFGLEMSKYSSFRPKLQKTRGDYEIY